MSTVEITTFVVWITGSLPIGCMEILVLLALWNSTPIGSHPPPNHLGRLPLLPALIFFVPVLVLKPLSGGLSLASLPLSGQEMVSLERAGIFFDALGRGGLWLSLHVCLPYIAPVAEGWERWLRRGIDGWLLVLFLGSTICFFAAPLLPSHTGMFLIWSHSLAFALDATVLGVVNSTSATPRGLLLLGQSAAVAADVVGVIYGASSKYGFELARVSLTCASMASVGAWYTSQFISTWLKITNDPGQGNIRQSLVGYNHYEEPFSPMTQARPSSARLRPSELWSPSTSGPSPADLSTPGNVHPAQFTSIKYPPSIYSMSPILSRSSLHSKPSSPLSAKVPSMSFPFPPTSLRVDQDEPDASLGSNQPLAPKPSSLTPTQATTPRSMRWIYRDRPATADSVVEDSPSEPIGLYKLPGRSTDTLDPTSSERPGCLGMEGVGLVEELDNDPFRRQDIGARPVSRQSTLELNSRTNTPRDFEFTNDSLQFPRRGSLPPQGPTTFPRRGSLPLNHTSTMLALRRPSQPILLSQTQAQCLASSSTSLSQPPEQLHYPSHVDNHPPARSSALNVSTSSSALTVRPQPARGSAKVDSEGQRSPLSVVGSLLVDPSFEKQLKSALNSDPSPFSQNGPKEKRRPSHLHLTDTPLVAAPSASAIGTCRVLLPASSSTAASDSSGAYHFPMPTNGEPDGENRPRPNSKDGRPQSKKGRRESKRGSAGWI